MKTHPTSKKERLKINREKDYEYDAFGDVVAKKNRYAPNEKNRPYCTDCGRSKMQFKSKAEAELFLLYNADDIEKVRGTRPIRAYYCPDCGCWHITSKPKRRKTDNIEVRNQAS